MGLQASYVALVMGTSNLQQLLLSIGPAREFSHYDSNEECQFKFRVWSRVAKVIKVQSGYSLGYLNDHIIAWLLNCSLLNLKWCLYS